MQVHVAALVYPKECGWYVLEDACLRSGGAGAGFTRAPVHVPEGLGEASGSHPRSAQIYLCRGISLNIQ